jgi:hypothetical protein
MSVPSYYIDIGWWSLAKAWDWPNSHSIEFAILTLVCAVFVRWVAARTIPTAERLIPDWASKLLGWFVIPGFGGLLTAFLFVWGALFVSEPAKQRNAAHSQIAKLEERVKESERVANFSFSFPFTRKIADQGVSASITVRNEAEHTIEIDEIKLVRMWVHDMSPFTGGPIRGLV